MSSELKVGIAVSCTGQFRAQGQQALAGLLAWVEDANRVGGIYVADCGKRLPIAARYYDDVSSRDQTRAAVERLITEDKVDLLFGPYSSGLTLAAAEVAERYDALLWNQGGASDVVYQRGYRLVVGILTPASQYLAALPQLVRQADPAARTLAIFRATPGTFPKVVSEGALEQSRKLGFSTTLVKEFPSTITDFSALLNEGAELRPDLLVVVGRIHNDLLWAAQLVKHRLSPGAVAVVAAPIQQFQDALGEGVEGFIGPSQWERTSSYPQDYGPSAEEVMESLRRMGQEQVDYPMAQAYAAGLVAQRCVEASGTLDNAGLREVASKLDFSTFYGRFKIDSTTGRQIGRSVALTQWQQGQKVVIWPPEQQQANLIYPWRRVGRR